MKDVQGSSESLEKGQMVTLLRDFNQAVFARITCSVAEFKQICKEEWVKIRPH